MYTAVSAIGVRFGVGKRWEQITLADFTVAQLVSTFRRWQVTLSIPSNSAPLYLDGDVVRQNWPTYASSFSQLLIDLGSASLPTTSTGIVLKSRSAYYKDGFKAGYTVTPVTHANSDNPSIPMDDKVDIRLTRLNPATDYLDFHKHYLVSINGFYHLTDTDGVKGVVVSEGMTTLKRSGQNQIGLFNFKNVGQLELVPVTDPMIQVLDTGKSRVTLSKNLEGKTVFLVLGGYFMTVDADAFYRVGESTYVIDFNKLPIKDRWFESSRYLLMKDMPVESTPVNPDEIDQADLTTEAFMRAYFKLSQSFFVILDCAEVFVERQFIRRSRLPDMYVSYKQPMYPMVTSFGRHPEYWATREDGQWSLCVYDNVRQRMIYDTVNQNAITGGIDDARVPMKRGELSMVHLLQIGRDV